MSLRPYQVRAIEAARQQIRFGKKRVVLVSPTGCHAKGQLVLMHNGLFIEVENIVPGDLLWGGDGQTRTVLGLVRGRGEMVRITPNVGPSFVVNLDHIMVLHHRNRVVDVSLREVLKWPAKDRKRAELVRSPLSVAGRCTFRTELIGEDDYYGCVVDGDGRYVLAPCFTITHNSGKTRIASAIAASHVARSEKHSVLWLAHRHELLRQAERSLAEAGVPAGRSNVAMVQAVQRDVSRAPDASLVVYDECHHAPSAEWSKIVARYFAGNTTVIGLTATPERTDGKGLGSCLDGTPLFEGLVNVASVRELTEQGHLVPCSVYGPSKTLRSKSIAIDPIAAMQKHSHGRRTIAFLPTVKLAVDLAVRANAAGIPAAAVWGEMDTFSRGETLHRHKTGSLQLLTSVAVLTEGYDDPETSCVVLARGCGSVGLYLQIVGRCLRPAPGKTDAVLLDLAGVANQFGAPDAEREWCLEGSAIRDADTDDYRFCPVCSHPIAPDAASCEQCGWERPGQEWVQQITNDPLVKFAGKRAEGDEQRIATLARWLRNCIMLGQKPGAAMHKYKAVYGDFPPRAVVSAAQASMRAS